MSLYDVPVLPHLVRFNGQVSIPPPSSEAFDTVFGGVLPPAQILTSYWGITTYYLIQPSHPNPSTFDPPRHVVLVHGLGTPAIGLLPLATTLAASSTPTTVLIYDNWGHGLSSTPLTAHVPSLFHLQIIQLFSHLKWPRAHFFGYSFGSIIATSFAEDYASLVESLVLVAPAGLLKKSNLTAWARFVEWGGWGGWGWEAISARRIYEFLGPGPVEEGWEKNFREKGLNAIPREAVQVWEREKHSGHVASLISSYRYGGLYDSHRTYQSIAKGDFATLVLLGENDKFFEAEYIKEELRALAWRGKVEVVNGVGHGVIAEKAKEVEEFVLAFWDSLQKREGA